MLKDLSNAVIRCCGTNRNQNWKNLFEAIDKVYEGLHARVSTNRLNRWLERAIQIQKHPKIYNKSVDIKYIAQTGTDPVTLTLFLSRSNKNIELHETYIRYLKNSLRSNFEEFKHSSIKFMSRHKKNPFTDNE